TTEQVEDAIFRMDLLKKWYARRKLETSCISRQDRGGSRAVKLFEWMVGENFHSICKQRLDEQVAELSEIAFPGHRGEKVQVRNSRRVTTRRGRAAKPRPSTTK